MGLVHIYCGDGKGKTTACVGLALRSCGAKQKVLFAQFFKNGDSSEVAILKQLDGMNYLCAKQKFGFYFAMNDQQKKAAKQVYTQMFEDIVKDATAYDVIVLDEIISTYNYGVIDAHLLLDFLKHKPEHVEVVMSGREPQNELLALADYVSEVKHIKHPYEKGIQARKGIDY